jgi:hypothetical protein
MPGTKIVTHQSLVDPCKMLFPPLQVKLDLMKDFVKALDRNDSAFSFLCEKFPRLSTEKIKEGVLFFFFFFFCPALQPGVGLGLLDDQPPLVPISRLLCPASNSHFP